MKWLKHICKKRTILYVAPTTIDKMGHRTEMVLKTIQRKAVSTTEIIFKSRILRQGSQWGFNKDTQSKDVFWLRFRILCYLHIHTLFGHVVLYVTG